MCTEPKVKHLKEIARRVDQFSMDHSNNIKLIVEYAGEHLEADGAFYNKIVDGRLITVAAWNEPVGFNRDDSPEGHLCSEVIRTSASKCLIISNLRDTSYYETDPNVSKYNLHTYIGYGVECNQDVVGSLCVVFTKERKLTEFDKDLLNILGAFIGIEESRANTEEAALKSTEFLYSLLEGSLDIITGVDTRGRVVLFNKSAQERFDYQTEEIVDGHIKTIYKDESEFEKVSNNLKGAGKFRGEVLVKDKSGEEFTALLSASRVYSKFGEYLGTVGIYRDVSEQIKMIQALERRDKILQTISNTADKLLGNNKWEDVIESILEDVGYATKVSRVYIFENTSDDKGDTLTSQTFEWCDDAIVSEISNTSLMGLNMNKGGFQRWVNLMSKGETVVGSVKDFPRSEQELLISQGIQSIVVIPIMVDGEWWGFIGFDECCYDREWLEPEIDALKTVASTLGAGIQRDIRVEMEEQQQRERWEEIEKQIHVHMGSERIIDPGRESKQNLFKAMTLMKNSN